MSEVGPTEVRPDPEMVEAIARRVAELLADDPRPVGLDAELIDAATLARRLGISRATVYAKAEQLGAIRLGQGKRARLRFDPTRLPSQLEDPRAAGRSRARRRRPAPARQTAPLLPINRA